MIIYLINIVLLSLWALIFLFNTQSKLKRKLFCIIASFQWIALSGLRHISIGDDTFAYKVFSFDTRKYFSWSELLISFKNVILGIEQGKDPGYYLFEKLIHTFTSEYQILLIVIALIFTILFGRWVYKYSSNPYISFMIYSTLFYSFYAITGHRQTISTALVVFLGYELVIKRKFLLFLFVCLLAATIHRSSLIFVPFYFLTYIKLTRKFLLFFLLLLPLLFYFRFEFFSFIISIIGYEGFANQDVVAGSWRFSFILLGLYLVTIWRYDKIIANNPKSNHHIMAIVISLILLPLTFVNPASMRAVQYFSLFIMLLVPELINSFELQERPLVTIISITTLILLFLRNAPHYLFFWQ